ncbi:MAG: hypothetical protein HY235_01690 [Acidobacteria bacterium]|nr:hypothetical protein [Acidobacteriota bacterium]
MQFVLTGFRQDMGFRIFAFEGIGQDRTRTAFTVKTDVGLARKYGIQLQELPLLCRELLDRRDQGEEKRTFTYTEEDMRLCSNARAAARAAAAQKRKPPRRPATDHVGAAWRVPPGQPGVGPA